MVNWDYATFLFLSRHLARRILWFKSKNRMGTLCFVTLVSFFHSLSCTLKVILYSFKYQNHLTEESDLVSLQLVTRHHHPLGLQQTKNNYRGWIPWTGYCKSYSGVTHNLTVSGNCTQKCLTVHVAYSAMLRVTLLAL